MSKNAWKQTDDDPGTPLPAGAPEGQVQDDSFATKENEPIPVQSDDAKVEEPINTEMADTDQQLGACSLLEPLVPAGGLYPAGERALTASCRTR